MNLIEHLLTCLNEESVEVAQQSDKALRFGLDDVNFKVPNGPDNRVRLETEMNQWLEVAQMCVEAGILPADWNTSERAAQTRREKRKMVNFCMDYARKKGTLATPPPNPHSMLGRMVQATQHGRVFIGVCDAENSQAFSLHDACEKVGDEFPARGDIAFQKSQTDYKFV